MITIIQNVLLSPHRKSIVSFTTDMANVTHWLTDWLNWNSLKSIFWREVVRIQRLQISNGN
jgi:hypothetical protein